MENVVEIYYEKAPDWKVNKVIWQGTEIPWDIHNLDIKASYVDGYDVAVFLENHGQLKLYPTKVIFHDETPPAPKCDACGQDLPKEMQNHGQLA